MRSRRRGITVVEILVSLVIGLPMIYIAWNALYSARHAEEVTAMSAACRGATLLERYLRQDCASVDIDLGYEKPDYWPKGIVVKGGKEATLTIKQAKPGNNPYVVKSEVVYKFLPSRKGYKVLRQGKVISGLLLAEKPTVANAVSTGGIRSVWCTFSFSAMDPAGKEKRTGGLIKYDASILVPIPQSRKVKSNIDYSAPLSP
mgnify:CR=1 FL=1